MASDSSALVVQARGLCKSISGPESDLKVLENIDIAVSAGESVAILGPSGSGKSTLLGLLAGLDQPSAGDVHLDGQALRYLDEDGRARVRAGRVGFVFQSFQLLPSLTALENVMLPLELLGSPAYAAASSALQRVGLTGRASHYPRQLSGGEQQRVAIARAFVTHPGILFADEPTGNLDEVSGRQVIDLLFSLNMEHATALILVTHDMSLAKRCRRRYCLHAGTLSPC